MSANNTKKPESKTAIGNAVKVKTDEKDVPEDTNMPQPTVSKDAIITS